MGTVRFSHHGQRGATIEFPYNDAGIKAIGEAERTVRRLAKRAKSRKGNKRSSRRY